MLKVISLFTGAGGLDLGFEAAGFQTCVAVDVDSLCCSVLQANRRWPIVEADVRDVLSDQLLRIAGIERGEADVLIGGPPCQPFSKSGYWARGDALRLEDSRADTLTQYLRVVRGTLPKVLLLENVSGFAYAGKSEGLKQILRGLEKINTETNTHYRPVWRVMDAASYGVPQRRERIFIIASRDGRAFTFPPATHGDPDEPEARFESFRTAWDALGDLPACPDEDGLALSGKWADLLPSIPEGQNYLWHTERGGGVPLFGWRTRYWSFLLKLSKRRPSWTIQAHPGPATGPFHWANRRLSIRELCRLQTFPDSFVFNCSRVQAQKMLGNAVPSLVAEVLALAIRKQLLDKPVKRESLKLLVPRQLQTPLAHPVASVREIYRPLVGNHEEHPGVSLGPRARLRM